MIKIYFDEGVDGKTLRTLKHALNAYPVSAISANEIIEECWEGETKLLIIPGGRDVPYHEKLKGKGNAKIRSYVTKGGSFLGICAGGYYGCSQVEFDRGMPLEVLGSRELAFFPGVGRGPAYGPGTFDYNSEQGARPSSISDGYFGGSFNSYFNGGCYFVDADNLPGIEIISRYLDLPANPAAIIECTLGTGKAVLSGVHFEMGASSFKTSLPEEIRKLLVEDEVPRKRFFDHVINSLLGL